MVLGKGAEMPFAERFSSASALIVERSEGSAAVMLLDDRSRVCSEDARVVDVKMGPNDASDWPFTIKDLSAREPTELGRAGPILEFRTSVIETRDLADEKASSENAESPVFSTSSVVNEFNAGSEPAGRLPSPVILRVVSVETEESSAGIAAGTPGKVRTMPAMFPFESH